MKNAQKEHPLSRGAERLIKLIEERSLKGKQPTTNQITKIYWQYVMRSQYRTVVDETYPIITYTRTGGTPKNPKPGIYYNLRLNSLKNIKSGRWACAWVPERREELTIQHPEVQQKAKNWYIRTLGTLVSREHLNVVVATKKVTVIRAA